ncbi:MAG: ankyrin repeat domain-containing protein [bacterium]
MILIQCIAIFIAISSPLLQGELQQPAPTPTTQVRNKKTDRIILLADRYKDLLHDIESQPASTERDVIIKILTATYGWLLATNPTPPKNFARLITASHKAIKTRRATLTPESIAQLDELFSAAKSLHRFPVWAQATLIGGSILSTTLAIALFIKYTKNNRQAHMSSHLAKHPLSHSTTSPLTRPHKGVLDVSSIEESLAELEAIWHAQTAPLKSPLESESVHSETSEPTSIEDEPTPQKEPSRRRGGNMLMRLALLVSKALPVNAKKKLLEKVGQHITPDLVSKLATNSDPGSSSASPEDSSALQEQLLKAVAEELRQNSGAYSEELAKIIKKASNSVTDTLMKDLLAHATHNGEASATEGSSGLQEEFLKAAGQVLAQNPEQYAKVGAKLAKQALSAMPDTLMRDLLTQATQRGAASAAEGSSELQAEILRAATQAFTQNPDAYTKLSAEIAQYATKAPLPEDMSALLKQALTDGATATSADSPSLVQAEILRAATQAFTQNPDAYTKLGSAIIEHAMQELPSESISSLLKQALKSGTTATADTEEDLEAAIRQLEKIATSYGVKTDSTSTGQLAGAGGPGLSEEDSDGRAYAGAGTGAGAGAGSGDSADSDGDIRASTSSAAIFAEPNRKKLIQALRKVARDDDGSFLETVRQYAKTHPELSSDLEALTDLLKPQQPSLAEIEPALAHHTHAPYKMTGPAAYSDSDRKIDDLIDFEGTLSALEKKSSTLRTLQDADVQKLFDADDVIDLATLLQKLPPDFLSKLNAGLLDGMLKQIGEYAGDHESIKGLLSVTDRAALRIKDWTIGTHTIRSRNPKWYDLLNDLFYHKATHDAAMYAYAYPKILQKGEILIYEDLKHAQIKYTDVLSRISKEFSKASPQDLYREDIHRVTPAIAAILGLGLYRITRNDEVQYQQFHPDAQNILELFINKGYDINHQTSEGATLLHAAASAVHMPYSVFKWLIDKGANSDIRTNNGLTALDIYTMTGGIWHDHCDNLHILKLLIVHTSKNNRRYKGPLHYAVEAADNNTMILRTLLESWFDVNTIDPSSGKTPLELAFSREHWHNAQLLIEYGAKIDLHTRECFTKAFKKSKERADSYKQKYPDDVRTNTDASLDLEYAQALGKLLAAQPTETFDRSYTRSEPFEVQRSNGIAVEVTDGITHLWRAFKSLFKK